MFDGVDDPTDFDSLVLRHVDDALRCPICKDFYDAPVITSQCSHTFCSLCIRRALIAEGQCPACRTPAEERQLHSNLAIETLVDLWKHGRRSLLQEWQDLKTGAAAQSSTTNGSGEANATMENEKSLTDVDAEDVSTTAVKGSSDLKRRHSGSASLAVRMGTRSASRSQASQSSSPDTSSTVHAPPSETTTDPSIVPCPSCSRQVPLKDINRHLDACLSGVLPNEESSPSSTATNAASTSTSGSLPFWGVKPNNTIATTQAPFSPTFPSPIALPSPASAHPSSPSTPPKTPNTPHGVNLGKKPTKIVYSMYAAKDLRRILRELGLPDHGDKPLLQRRHQEYVTLYNANLDSSHPVSHHILKQRLRDWESIYLGNTTDMNGSLLPAVTQAIVDPSKGRDVESEHERVQYAKANADAFNDLIAQAGRRSHVKRMRQEPPR